VRKLIWAAVGVMALAGIAVGALAWQRHWRADYWLEISVCIDSGGHDPATQAARMREAEIRIHQSSGGHCLVTCQGEDRLNVLLGADDPKATPGESSEARRLRLEVAAAQLRRLLETPGQISLHLVDAWDGAADRPQFASDSERWRRALSGERVPGFRLVTYKRWSPQGARAPEQLLIQDAPIVDNEGIRGARTISDSSGWITQIELTTDGGRRLGDATSPARVRYGSDRLVFLMDGVPQAVHVISDRLNGRRVNFAVHSSREEAEVLRQCFNAGTFPLPGARVTDCRVAQSAPSSITLLMAQIRRTFRWLVDFISALGYPGILILMAMESSIFPVPSELVMPPAGYLAQQGQMNALLVILCGTVGSLIGAYANYFVSRWLGRPLVIKYGKYVLISEKKFARAEAFFLKHGEVATFIGRLLPVVRHLISIPAGLARMPLAPFVLYTAVGATLWNGFLTYLGVRLKEHWYIIQQYTHIIDYFVVAGMLAVAAYFIWKLRASRTAA